MKNLGMKKIVLISGMMIAAGIAAASPLTPAAALERARGEAPARIAGKAASFELRMTRAEAGVDAVYVFERSDGGFIVTPADDCAPAILGYGEGRVGDGNGESAPGFMWWIDNLARQVKYASEHSGGSSPARIARPDRDPVGPLCKTFWNQGAPYNFQCPEVNGERSVTGCVATAMSQVMKYHGWPESGTGTKEYEWNGRTLSIDFSECDFEWDQMLDSYPYEYHGDYISVSGTERQQQAVALLMKAAGHSVEMNYSPSASGAQSLLIAGALGEYFRYDKSLRYLMRDYYSLEDWEAIIYNSLVNDGPVAYAGQSTIGGHSFVCDGYDKDGYFHFNWGWGGLSDGYFLLDALDPIHQGIGGADGGFDFMQDVVVGIRPDREGTSEWSDSMMIGASDLNMRYDPGENALYVNVMVYNSGPGPIADGMVGYAYEKVSGNEEPIYQLEAFGECRVRYGFSSYALELPDLEDGDYRVYPVYKVSTDDEAPVLTVRFPMSGAQYYSLHKNGEGISLSSEAPKMAEFSDIELPVEIKNNEVYTVRANVRNVNSTPYGCYVWPRLSITWASGRRHNDFDGAIRVIDISANSTEAIEFAASFDLLNRKYPDSATATIALYAQAGMDGEEVMVSEEVPVKLILDDSGVAVIESDPTGVAREYYTPSGVRAGSAKAGDPTPELPAGLYIVRSANGSAKIVVR